MIKIDKGSVPKKFKNGSERLLKKVELEFITNRIDCLSGKYPWKFSEYYKSSAIKEELTIVQSNKCCFSEAKFDGDYPHVEHFRPKGMVEDQLTKQKIYPGYYWLAFNYENLFLCKSVINSTYKRNFFPIENSRRNRTHFNKFKEKNILIDPSIENPRDHIRFFKDEPYPITERGKQNINILGLRDSSFVESRKERILILNTMRELVDIAVAGGYELTHPKVIGAVVFLRNSIKKDAAYSSMAIDYLSEWPHL